MIQQILMKLFDSVPDMEFIAKHSYLTYVYCNNYFVGLHNLLKMFYIISDLMKESLPKQFSYCVCIV